MPRSAGRTDANFWGGLERRIRAEWLLATLAMMLFTMALSYFSDNIGFSRLNHAFYDKTLAAAVHAVDSKDIVIVAIDDGSIDQIGYWPWRRSVHAQLLARLGQARAVGLDLVFSEVNPAYPQDDEQLAQAVRHHGKVVLPLVLDEAGGSALAPLAPLAGAARQMGYINIYPDEDGVIRSLTLERTLASGEKVEHFVIALMRAAHEPAQPAAPRQAGSAPLLLPYAGTPGHFTIYPYAQVLNGQIPESDFKGKYVLVGSWGSGLGDAFPTPLSRQGESMSGVEILANGLQSALRRHWISSPGRWQTALLSTLPVLLICLVLRRLSPRRSFLLAMAVLFLVFAASWLLMRYASVWIPVTASLVGTLLAYPVWSWRSQEAALQHIDRELQALSAEQPAVGNALSPGEPSRRDGSLSARVTHLHSAIAQLRHAQRKREETLQFLSHDMRAPQNSILALTQLQDQAESAMPQAELLRRIDRYAHKTLGLVDGFVQLARAEAAGLRNEALDLVELVELGCDDFWAQARQRHIRIVIAEHPDAAWIRGDEALLRRAWCNLVDNAIKYSPDHSEIHCRIVRDRNDWLAIIRDQGRGISAAQQATLFTPFIRANEDKPG
ncbi:MAG: CHASE2 domain-containing protein, partial [Pollutimonas bauzanensis]